jgi:hypothetical protein
LSGIQFEVHPGHLAANRMAEYKTTVSWFLGFLDFGSLLTANGKLGIWDL